MKKSLFLVLIAMIVASCETPNVTEGQGNIEQEVLNRGVRQIDPEKEEIFGFQFTDQILEDFNNSQLQADSIGQQKGFDLFFVDTINIKNQPEYVQQAMDMFAYNLERGSIPTDQPSHIDKNVKRPFYYNTKVVIQDSTFLGFWLLKIDAAAIRRNMPE